MEIANCSSLFMSQKGSEGEPPQSPLLPKYSDLNFDAAILFKAVKRSNNNASGVENTLQSLGKYKVFMEGVVV